MYQEIQLKKLKETTEPSGTLRQSAPQFTAMKKVKKSPNTADISKGTGASMDGMRIHYRSNSTITENRGSHSRANSQPAPAVQGKFEGGGVEKILRKYAVKYPNSTFSALFQVLDSSPEVIFLVAQWGQSRYDSKDKTLYLNFSIFQQLDKALEENDWSTISSLLSNICHELSHAHDFIGDGTIPPKESLTEGRMSDETFISTELRAWAREAISILEINKQYRLAYNDSNKELIEGWEAFRPDMLDDLFHNKENCIIKRLIQYLSKRKGMFEASEVQDWLNSSTRKERYKTQLTRLQASVMNKKEHLFNYHS